MPPPHACDADRSAGTRGAQCRRIGLRSNRVQAGDASIQGEARADSQGEHQGRDGRGENEPHEHARGYQARDDEQWAGIDLRGEESEDERTDGAAEGQHDATDDALLRGEAFLREQLRGPLGGEVVGEHHEGESQPQLDGCAYEGGGENVLEGSARFFVLGGADGDLALEAQLGGD